MIQSTHNICLTMLFNVCFVMTFNTKEAVENFIKNSKEKGSCNL